MMYRHKVMLMLNENELPRTQGSLIMIMGKYINPCANNQQMKQNTAQHKLHSKLI